MAEVCSLSSIRAKMTVKKGADDLTVSVNDTATYLDGRVGGQPEWAVCERREALQRQGARGAGGVEAMREPTYLSSTDYLLTIY